MKVRTRIMIAFLVIGALGFTYLFNFVKQVGTPVYLESIEDGLVETATLLAAVVAADSGDGAMRPERMITYFEDARRRPLGARIYNRLKTSMDLRLYITDAAGVVVYDSENGDEVGQDYSKWRDVARTLAGEYGARATWSEFGDTYIQTLYVAAPVHVGDRILGVVSVGKATPKVFTFYQKIQSQAFAGISLAALLWTLGGVFITIWVTKPIQKLTEYAFAVRDGRRATPPQLEKSDIGRLGVAFEEMRDALEGKKYVEEYVQTLTHEIKSPLSAIRGAAELLHEDMPEDRRDKFLQNIRGESGRIQNIVDRLLELSAIESRKQLKSNELMSMRDLVIEVVDACSPSMEAKGIRAVLSGDQDFDVRGEKFLIRLAVSNLLQNAIAFSPPKGRIEIGLAHHALTIRDNGPGIPEYATDRVFERFYSLQRPDSGRKSSGLGLSIVKSVADLHHGAIRLENHPEGGAVATFSFPN